MIYGTRETGPVRMHWANPAHSQKVYFWRHDHLLRILLHAKALVAFRCSHFRATPAIPIIMEVPQCRGTRALFAGCLPLLLELSKRFWLFHARAGRILRRWLSVPEEVVFLHEKKSFGGARIPHMSMEVSSSASRSMQATSAGYLLIGC